MNGLSALRQGAFVRSLATLLLCSLVVGCSEAEARAFPAKDLPVDPAAEPATERAIGFTWSYLGTASAAVLNMGTTLDSPVGPVRTWCLVVHLPGTEEPLTTVPGLMPIHESWPIFFRGTNFLVELRPAEGKAWGELSDASELTVVVDGLF